MLINMKIMRSFVQMKNDIAFMLAVVICLVGGVGSIVYSIRSYDSIPTSAISAKNVLVIDAGHGGIDGGAIGVDGSKESDINLAIAQKLQALAIFCGKAVKMTRTDDTANCEYKDYSEHRELVRRAELANSTPGAVLISIHQNCYPTALPQGAHIIFSGNGNSAELGETIQKNITAAVDKNNRRVAQPDKNKLYILSNVSCPAVLVECGFMSNHFDIGNLRDSSYQKALSAVLFASYIQFITAEKSV